MWFWFKVKNIAHIQNNDGAAGFQPLSSKFKAAKQPSANASTSVQDTAGKRELNKYGGVMKEVKKSKGFDCIICDFTTTQAAFLQGHMAR